MPRIQTLKAKKYPEGWDLIEPTLMEMQNEMKDVENAPHEGKRRVNLYTIEWKLLEYL